VVSRALTELRRAAEGSDNVLVPMKAALAALATTGEVAAALRDVWGSYQPTDAF
jgi:methylmalonyl-CoA mutase, N-terminal domain